LTIKPDRDELTGKYELTSSSMEFLAEQGFQAGECTLELFKDGQFKFTHGPDLVFNSLGISKQQFIDKAGKWFVSCDEKFDCLIELEGVCVVPLALKNEKLAILITIGDGDECSGIIYEKTGKS
jgi:hypothetical protein